MQKNDFLKQLAKEQIIELVECMYEMRARAGQWVIQEGEPGDRLFVVAGRTISCSFIKGLQRESYKFRGRGSLSGR